MRFYGNIPLMVEHNKITIKKALKLDSGEKISGFDIAYESWGKINADKSNVIVIMHALTGDQYVAGKHPITNKKGWWDDIVGKGRILDTDKYYVICANVIGGCMGSFGPTSINPKTKKPYALTFPIITISDMVNAHALLLDELGIDKISCMIGGSMGGMQVLEFVAKFPNRVERAIAIATTSRHSAQNIAFHEIGRQAIMADPDWCGGDYIAKKKKPRKGLSVARMTAHVTYMSEESLQDKFGRALQGKNKVSYGFDADFQVESYLRHQGISFVDRFDANSYLYITRAMDYFDMEEAYGKHLAEIFKTTTTKFLLVSFTSDWCYPTEETKYIVRALTAAGSDTSFVEIKTSKGHDAFLLDEKEFKATLKGFIGK
ncbi:MAG: homoserine O-acetyltransferase [Alphaproteobacteria bacterium CG11_big_fil_rev_8_21_14_0_20_44_7]|nr:MAG: homoserine O-acetyltransferase [Alphaproteobacteria bacterium CG11_big_fil_rev_8_21_14_0_20_44_7]